MLLLGACLDYAVDEVDSHKPIFDSGEPLDSVVVDSESEMVETAEGTGTAPVEACNGIDDDGDGLVDEGYADADADGTADCMDVEECDGLDNDGDGGVDEDFDLDADGIADCEEVEHEVFVRLTADDAFDLWIDGVASAAGTNWGDAQEAEAVLDSGPHVLAVHAWDVYGMPTAFRAAVYVDGVEVSGTGDGSWVYSRGDPGLGWEGVGFDDSGFGPPEVCTGGWWGSSPAELSGSTALWVWEGDCTGVGEAWFRLELELA